MFNNPNILILFVCTLSAVLTYWFLLGLLTQAIKNFLSIVACALEVILSFFFGYISKLSDALDKTIRKPIRRVMQSIHIPPLIKAIWYVLLGAVIFILDHRYATKIYAEDQTSFYHIFFQGKTYWVTQTGLTIGGLFIGLAVLIVLYEILKALDTLLNRTIRVAIVFQR